MGRKRAQCRLFILPHEAAVAVHVGAENGGELALQYPPLMMAIILPRVNFVKLDNYQSRFACTYGHDPDNSASSALASLKSAVSKPSVNQL